jgi:hypothetical protein
MKSSGYCGKLEAARVGQGGKNKYLEKHSTIM